MYQDNIRSTMQGNSSPSSLERLSHGLVRARGLQSHRYLVGVISRMYPLYTLLRNLTRDQSIIKDPLSTMKELI